MEEEFTEKEREMMTIMAAHSLLRDWLQGDDITEYLDNPSQRYLKFFVS